MLLFSLKKILNNLSFYQKLLIILLERLINSFFKVDITVSKYFSISEVDFYKTYDYYYLFISY